ncbi:aspartyl/asparaginyl beta-hydroxylase domain-containing protein [Pedobacter sp. MW01-1-1]|uniref:aspartyl/asparaginyl beta-hydroxylase domain-containing protein n=1 Tax=Pedobacter sp. MW01-1-1 TaxID=3383027 RepID=UPI003FED8EC3
MLKYIQFPFQYEAALLKQELVICLQMNWNNHFNSKDYNGDWKSIALRSSTGNENDIYSNYGVTSYTNTGLLAQLPYIQSIIASWNCETEAIRLMALHPNSEIRPHRDRGCNYKNGTFRIHIPIVTNDKVFFDLEGEKLFLQEGSCWYIDFENTHSIKNEGDTVRVHLVIDGLRNEWSDALFQQNGYVIEQHEVPQYDEQTKQMMIAELEKMDTDAARQLIEQLKAN